MARPAARPCRSPPQRRRCDMTLRNLTAKDQWTLSDNSLLRRILVCFLGEVITAVGIAICLEGKSGVDPFTAFLQGISHVSGISFSAIVPIVNIIMLILVLPFDRSIFGLGTVVNFTIVASSWTTSVRSTAASSTSSTPWAACSSTWRSGCRCSAWESPCTSPATWASAPMTGSLPRSGGTSRATATAPTGWSRTSSRSSWPCS